MIYLVISLVSWWCNKSICMKHYRGMFGGQVKKLLRLGKPVLSSLTNWSQPASAFQTMSCLECFEKWALTLSMCLLMK